MTTAAEMKAYAAPVIERFPELVWSRRELVLPPVLHLVRSIVLDGSSVPKSFRPVSSVSPVFMPDGALGLHCPRRFRRNKPCAWMIDDPESVGDLGTNIGSVLPELRAVETIDDFIARDQSGDFETQISRSTLIFAVIQTSRGRFDEAIAIAEGILAQRKHWRRGYDEYYSPLVFELLPLLRLNDRPRIARLLHEWEAGTVAKNKLTKLWEPTPFPFEVAAG